MHAQTAVLVHDLIIIIIIIHSGWEIAETERLTALMWIMVSQAQRLNFLDMQTISWTRVLAIGTQAANLSSLLIFSYYSFFVLYIILCYL